MKKSLKIISKTNFQNKNQKKVPEIWYFSFFQTIYIYNKIIIKNLKL